MVDGMPFLEAELGDLALGPDHSWHQSFRKGSCADDLPLAGEEASQRLQCLRSLQDQGLLDPLQDCTPYLRSHVSSRLVNARLSGEDSLQVPEILQYAIDHGHPQLAEEASKALDSMSPTTKAGAALRDDEATFSSCIKVPFEASAVFLSLTFRINCYFHHRLGFPSLLK